MKALITGGNGMLGSALAPLLVESQYEVFLTDTISLSNNAQFLDIRDYAQVKLYIEKVKPDIIFHLAAETNVDRCELEPDHAFKTNVLGTKNIALACKEYNITMVYISTCGVFDGKKSSGYRESDIPSPISVYTKSKYEGEKEVQRLLSKYFIFRAGWMMGGGKKDKKFVAKIVELSKTQKILNVVNDKRGSPTFTKDFSEAIIKVIITDKFGLYHVTNEGAATRYDIACKIIEYLGKTDVLVKPIGSDEFPLPAPRPDSEVAENYNLKTLNIKIRPWTEALKEYLEELIK